ncbi:hypothetical protein [Carboxylicivirga sp. N1Y90]|uniref:hypothetical protein n=1 Tax=Carboxylicivirga fragile TaxID=3417571 RepID=UPI003D332234|nr:hypothetical protein [Marinilabiliaceae bacterium N1Y90]
MNYKAFIFIALTLILGCQSFTKENANERSVRLYIHSLNEANYHNLDQLMSDSILMSEQEYTILKGKEQFHTFFQWDSVFSPYYHLLHIQETKNGINTTISKNCKRITFLQDSASIYKTTFYFDKNKISKIHTTENVYFDTARWTQNRDTLVNWINQNHPELNGFIYNMTAEGAENYLEAMRLFKEQ